MKLILGMVATVIFMTLALVMNHLMEAEEPVVQTPINQVGQQPDMEIIYRDLSVEDLIILADLPVVAPETLLPDYTFEGATYWQAGGFISLHYTCMSDSPAHLVFVQETQPIEFIPFSPGDFVQRIEVRTPGQNHLLPGYYAMGTWNEAALWEYMNHTAYAPVIASRNAIIPLAYQALVWSDQERGRHYWLFTVNSSYYHTAYSPCHLAREDLIAFAWNMKEANAENYPPSTLISQPQLFVHTTAETMPSEFQSSSVSITGLTHEEAETLAGYPIPEMPNSFYRFQEAQFDETSQRITLIYEFGLTETNTLLLHIKPLLSVSDLPLEQHDFIRPNTLVRQVRLDRTVGEYITGNEFNDDTLINLADGTSQWLATEKQRLRWLRGSLLYELAIVEKPTSVGITDILPALANQLIASQGNQFIFFRDRPRPIWLTEGFTTVTDLVNQTEFPVAVPDSLPEGFTFFKGYQAEQEVIQTYTCGAMGTNLFIMQVAAPYATPIEMYGESETVMLGSISAEYAVGGWRYEVDENSLFVVRHWESVDASVHQLRWYKDGYQYHIEQLSFPADDPRASNACALSKAEITTLAESLMAE